MFGLAAMGLLMSLNRARDCLAIKYCDEAPQSIDTDQQLA